MKCKQAKYRLSEYLDGCLNEQEKIRVEKHLDRCSNCKERFEDLKNYQHLVSNLETKRAPENFEEKVLERIQRKEPAITRKRIMIPLWVKTVAAAAIILGFIYLILPDQYFSPAVVETEYIPFVEKRSKGGGGDKKGPKIDDARVRFINDLATKYGGKILHIEYSKPDELINAVLLELPKKPFTAFVAEYNRSNQLNELSDVLPFTLNKKIRLKIYLGSNAYQVKDLNGDGFDDLLMLGLTGQNKDQVVVAYNNKEGLFSKPATIVLPVDVNLISNSRNRFEADINGDGKNEIIERISSGEHPVWIFYSDSSKSDKSTIYFEPHASGYFGEFMIFFGDFNGDGFDDILAKNGSSIKEGEWYISLNNRENGFKLGYELRFGESRYFVFEYALFD